MAKLPKNKKKKSSIYDDINDSETEEIIDDLDEAEQLEEIHQEE
jgi:hypothetical protein